MNMLIGLLLLLVSLILLSPLYDKYVDFMLTMPMGHLYKREKLELYGKITAIILAVIGTCLIFLL